MMRIPLLIGTALIAAAPAAAQEKAPEPPTQKQLKAAGETLSLLVSAFNSKDVPQETKNGLFVCLYENSLSDISASATKAFAGNTDLDPTNATQHLLVLAKVCGAPVPEAADKAPAAKPDANASGAEAESR